MPIYDYQCRKCSSEFELLVIGKTVPACPSCLSEDIEQQLSAFAVSTEQGRLASAAKSRRAQATSSTYKEQQVAQAEYEKEHRH